MLRHWPPCVISKISSCFMYKRMSSLYTLNTVESHVTWIGLRKSCRIVNVIWYRGSSLGSSLSIGFASPCLSYTVHKHNSMTVNTLFVTNTTKGNTYYKKGFKRCVSQARKVFSACPTNWISWVGIAMWDSTSQTSSMPTFTWSLPKETLWTVVDPSKTLQRETRWGGFSSTHNLM